MGIPSIKSIQPSKAKDLFGNLSQTNQYQVSFTLPGAVESHAERKFGVTGPNKFLIDAGGLLCADASLPGSNLATVQVNDNFMGISQEFVHSRVYADLNLTFYVDNDYTNLRIFEAWIDYITSGSEVLGNGDNMSELSLNYYRRMNYPEKYKAQTMYITKFEKNIGSSEIQNQGSRLDYLFVNAFPKIINATPISYGGADILKVGVQFNYDRYIINPQGSVSKGFAPSNDSFLQSLKAASAELQARTVEREASVTSSEPVASELPNTGTGRDGNFGQGTYGQGLPSNPNFRSVTSEAQIRDRRNYGNTVPEGSFSVTPKVPIRNRRGRIIGYK